MFLHGLFLLASSLAAAFVAFVIYAMAQVHPKPAEVRQKFAGDDLIPNAIGAVNHAITIHRPRREVWPWLVQMGAGRAGWYAYDFIDNGARPSASSILPEYQSLSAGMIFPAVPGATDAFLVVQCEPERSLVLSWKQPNGVHQTTWSFVLEESQPGETRLVVRGRVASGYRPFGLPQWIALLLGRPAHFIMQRKQLLGIARRVEANDQTDSSREFSQTRRSR